MPVMDSLRATACDTAGAKRIDNAKMDMDGITFKCSTYELQSSSKQDRDNVNKQKSSADAIITKWLNYTLHIVNNGIYLK